MYKNTDELLFEVMKLFDEIDKMILAKKLLKTLEIDANKPFVAQVKDLLNRSLTAEEEFKLNILEKTLAFSHIEAAST